MIAPEPNPNELEALRAQIRDLQEGLLDAQTRSYAMEAMLIALLEQVPLKSLDRVEARYDSHVDTQAEGISPKNQRGRWWKFWSAQFSTLRAYLKTPPPAQ